MGRAGPALVVALGAIAAGFGAAWYLYESSPPLRSAGGPAAAGKGAAKESGGPKKRSSASTSSASMRVTIIYGTTTGTARNLAKNLQDKLNAAGAGSIQCRVVDMAAYDFEDLESEEVVIAIVSTYTGGEAPATAASFFRGLAESTTDFRVGKNSLSSTRYAVFGLGSSEYAEYCSAGRRLDTLLEELGGQQMLLMGEGDDVVGTDRSFAAWTLEITGLVTKGSEALVNSSVPSRATKGERRQGKRASPGTVPNGLGGGEEEPTEEDLINDQQLTDLEDLGAVMASSSSDAASAAREMITPLQRKSLQKEGYKLIGSHSAVKMCRWTKAQMRGRGGCYKVCTRWSPSFRSSLSTERAPPRSTPCTALPLINAWR
jgi:tRNA wybutosine-synthesizing protein 1